MLPHTVRWLVEIERPERNDSRLSNVGIRSEGSVSPNTGLGSLPGTQETDVSVAITYDASITDIIIRVWWCHLNMMPVWVPYIKVQNPNAGCPLLDTAALKAANCVSASESISRKKELMVGKLDKRGQNDVWEWHIDSMLTGDGIYSHRLTLLDSCVQWQTKYVFLMIGGELYLYRVHSRKKACEEMRKKSYFFLKSRVLQPQISLEYMVQFVSFKSSSLTLSNAQYSWNVTICKTLSTLMFLLSYIYTYMYVCVYWTVYTVHVHWVLRDKPLQRMYHHQISDVTDIEKTYQRLVKAGLRDRTEAVIMAAQEHTLNVRVIEFRVYHTRTQGVDPWESAAYNSRVQDVGR